MEFDLVDLLNKVTSAKGDSIATVSEKLKQALDQPDAVLKLLNIIKDGEPKTKEAAAVFLRRKLKSWKSWDASLQEHVKNEVLALLDSVKSDSTAVITRSTIQLASSAFDMSLTEKSEWTELLQWLERNCCSDSDECRKVCFTLINSLTEVPDERMTRLIPFFLKLIEIGYGDNRVAQIRYSALKSAGNLIVHANDFNQSLFLPFLNQAHSVINSLIKENLDLDTDPFNILVESLSNSALVALVNLQPSLELAIEIAAADSAPEYLRKCALQYVSEVVKQRSSIIVKLQAMDSLFGKVFELICRLDDAEREEDTMLQSCTQVVDVLCQRLPSTTFVPILQKYVDAATKSDNPLVRRAAYMTLAVSMEGCCRFYTEHCLEDLIRLILLGIADAEGLVTLSAMFALGELLAYAEGSASSYAPLFMPVILSSLSKIALTDYEKSDENLQLMVSRVFYALEEACECLDNDLQKYLTELFSILTVIHQNNRSMRMHELALESISYAVCAVDKLISPYVNDLLDLLSKYLQQERTDENEGAFSEALGALSSIFRYAESPAIRQHADESLQFVLRILKDADYEPALKSSAYDVLAALTCVYKEEIDPGLVETIVEEITKTFKSTEGVMLPNSCTPSAVTNGEESSVNCIAKRTRSKVQSFTELKGDSTASLDESVNGEDTHAAGDANDTADIDEDEDEDDEDDDDDDDTDIDLIESEFSDERISALSLVCDLTANSENKFAPYMQRMFDPVFKHLDFPDESIQTQAINALTTILIACFTRYKEHTDSGTNRDSMQTVANMVRKLYEDLEEKIKEADTHDVVSAALGGIQTLISGMQEGFFEIINADGVSEIVKSVLARKIPCLNTAVDTEIDIEEPELDSRVIEAAGDIIPACGGALSPDDFRRLFMGPINTLMNQLKRPNSSRKAYVVGTIACTIKSCNEFLLDADITYNLFNTFLNDSAEEVAQNASYGMGLLIERLPEKFRGSCDSVLNVLHSLVQRTTGVDKSSLRDNVCGCACRILKSLGRPIVPQVLEFIMQLLPLKADKENYTAFFEMANEFANEEAMKPYLTDTLRLACTLLLENDDEVLEETKTECSKLLKSQLESNANTVAGIVHSFDDSQQAVLSKYVENLK